MKKSLLTLVSSGALLSLLSPIAFAGSTQSPSHLTEGDGYVLYHWMGAPGVNISANAKAIKAVSATPLKKGQQITVDPASVSDLHGAPEFASMKKAFDSGKLVIIEGNTKGQLSSALLRKVFQAPGPEVQHSYKDDPNAYIYAEGIIRLPGASMPSIFDIVTDPEHPWTDQQVVETMNRMLQHALGLMSQNSASSSTSNGTIQPNSSPGGSDGNYSFFDTTVRNVYASDGTVMGQFSYGYWATRKTFTSNMSEWVIKLDVGVNGGSYLYNTGQMTTGVDKMGQLDAVWTRVGPYNTYSGANYSGETMENGSLTKVFDDTTKKEQGQMSVTLSSSPSVTWQFPMAFNAADITTSDSSSLTRYAAYQFNWTGIYPDYPPPTSYSTGSQWYLQPGCSIQNTSGPLYVQTDTNPTFAHWYNNGNTVYKSYGDYIDTFYVTDLP